MSGFHQINQQLWIEKDPEAQLTYTLDWTDWLDAGDTITTAVWDIAARVNDPDPVTNESSGIAVGSKKTYIELAGGQIDKSYVVSVKITTGNGLIDRRNFRVKIVNRSA